MNSSNSFNQTRNNKSNQNIHVYVRVRPFHARERGIRSTQVIEVHPPKEIIAHNVSGTRITKKFTFDRTFGPESKQNEIYEAVVAPLIEEVLSGYNCTVFAYGQTGTGKTHTMVGTECAELKSSWEDASEIGIIPRALSHLFDELRMMELEFSMRISYLELYNEELCDLLSSVDTTKIRIFDDTTKKGSVIIQGLEEIPVHNKDDVYKLLEKGKERRKTATTFMNDQSSRSHTVFSILVHIKENGIDGEEMLKIGKLNLVDLAGSENATKAGNEKGIRTRETVNINQSLLTLGRVITALVERTPHIPYRESKLTRLLQESLGGRTKTSIIATISPGHKDLEETISTLEYAHRAKNIQNRPEVNQKLTKKTVLKEYTEEIDKLKRDLIAARDKNGIFLPEETYSGIQHKIDSQNRELNEKVLLLKALKEELANKEKIFNEVSLNLVEKAELLLKKDVDLLKTQGELQLTKKILTTTKRRYKEKKILLDSHMQTEEVLLDQATKLIEVADVATRDTIELHNTIDRRRDVDSKIQTACEQFANRIKETFELMDENLNTLQKDHNTNSDLIIDEIVKASKLQNRFVFEAMSKFDSMSKMSTNYVELFTECLQKLIETISSSCINHKSTVLAMLMQMQQAEGELTTNLKKRLSEMQSLFTQQKSIMENKNRLIAEKIEKSHSTLSSHTEKLKEHLQGIAKNSTSLLEAEITKLNANMESKEQLATRRKSALADFVKQMEQMELEDCELTNAITNVVGNLETSKTQVVSAVEAGIATADELSASHHQMLDHLQEGCKSLEVDAVANLEKCTTVSQTLKREHESIQTNIANCRTETNKSIEVNYTAVNSVLTAHTKEIDEARDNFVTESSNECEVIRCLTKHENTRLKEHNAQSIALTTSLKEHVNVYADIYNEQMTRCVETVDSFRKSEIKTYTPTGQTPSRKEFRYPRILASTSPHSSIVDRLRQENEWSDLDVTIDEDSEITPEIGDSAMILNSTPIGYSPIKISHSKESSKKKHDKNTNRKPLSRRNSPKVLIFPKENKENIFKD